MDITKIHNTRPQHSPQNQPPAIWLLQITSVKKSLPDGKSLETNMFHVLTCLAMSYIYCEIFILKPILETTAICSCHEFKQMMTINDSLPETWMQIFMTTYTQEWSTGSTLDVPQLQMATTRHDRLHCGKLSNHTLLWAIMYRSLLLKHSCFGKPLPPFPDYYI